jgi:hypothetical protein
MPLILWLALQDPWYESFQGKTPPEIKIRAEDWFNAEKPVTLESLRGKVVWLEFIGNIG